MTLHSIGLAHAIASILSAPLGAGSTQDPNPNTFNPQISLVGDFQLRARDSFGAEGEKAIFRELELGLAADADPFLRVEAYIALENEFEEEGDAEGHETKVDVEEAFGRYTNLGGGFTGKAGIIAGAIGRVNRNHRDQLWTLEYPFAVKEIFGEEGLRGPGLSLSYLAPTDRFIEFTVEALQPEEGPLFGESGFRKPVVVGRGRTFFDYTEDLSAQLGATVGTGPSAAGGDATFFGVDYTMKWQPGQKGRFASVEAEAYWYDTDGAGDGMGGFITTTYEVMPRWFLTGQYDFVDIPGADEQLTALSLGLTFRITEFQLWRAEWQRISMDSAEDRTLFTLQFQWLIGAHPAHKY